MRVAVRWRRHAVLLATAAVLLAIALGCSKPQPSKTVDATLPMCAGPTGGPLDKVLHVTLETSKDGRAPIVAGKPREGEVAGGHNFPPGTTAGGMAQYYRGLLASAGWKEGDDFSIEGEALTPRGVLHASLVNEPGPKYPEGPPK